MTQVMLAGVTCQSLICWTKVRNAPPPGTLQSRHCTACRFLYNELPDSLAEGEGMAVDAAS